MIFIDDLHVEIKGDSPCEELHIVTDKSVGITPYGWEPTSVLEVRVEDET